MPAMFDYSKLRGKIIEKFGTISRFSKELGVSPVTISYKLNNHNMFDQADIIQFQKALDLNWKEIDEYFFSFKS